MNLEKLIRENPYKFLACVVAIMILLYFFGCEAKAPSVLDPGKSVTKDELKAEFDLFLAKFNKRFADIETQEKLKQAIFNSSILMIETGSINLVGVLITLAGILGVGSTADTVRLRKQIKNGKSPPPTVNPPVTGPA